MQEQEIILENRINELKVKLAEAEQELAHLRAQNAAVPEAPTDLPTGHQLGAPEPVCKLALEHSPLLVYVKNSKGQYIYANPLSRKVLQLGEDYQFKSDFDLLPSQFAKTIWQHERIVLDSQQFERFMELLPYQKEGERYMHVYRFPIPIDRKTSWIGTIALDVNEQAHIERHRMDALAELEESHADLRANQEELLERNHRYVTLYNELLEANQQIEKSEARWQLASYASNTVFWEYNFLDSQKTWHSPVMEKLFGYKGNEALNTTEAFLNITHPDDKEMVLRMVEENLRNGGLYNLEYRVYAKNGDLRWVRAVGQTKYDKEGNPTHLLGSIIDITDIKNNELELQVLKSKLEQKVKQRTKDFVESEQKFRNAFEYSGIGIYLLGLDGIIRDTNRAFCEILGYEKQELEGLSDRLLLHADDFNQYIEDFQTLLANDTPYIKKDRRIKKKSGRYIQSRHTMSIVIDQKGLPQYFIAQVEDITKGKKAEEKILQQSEQIRSHNEELNLSLEQLSETSEVLRKSEEKYRLLAENMSDMVSIHDENGNYVYVSPSMERLMGYHQKEILQKNAYDFIHPHDQDRVWKENHQVLLRSEDDIIVKYRLKRKDGSYIYVESRSKARLDKEGNLEWIQVSTRDVTERHNASQAISIKNEQINFILDNLPIILYSLDANGNTTYISGKFLDFLVGEKENVIGMPLAKLLPLEEHGKQCLEDALKGKKNSWEGQIATTYLKHTLVPIKNAQKEVTGVIGLTEDITLEKEVEEHLHYLTSALINIHDAVVILDAKDMENGVENMSISYINPAFTSLFGYELQDALQHPLTMLAASESDKELFEGLQESLESEQPFQKDFLAYPKKGEPIWVDVSISLVKSEYNQVTHCVGVLRDITDRKKAEELLYQERQLFHEGLAVAMKWEISKNGKVTRYISPNIKQYGYEIDDFVKGRVHYIHDFVHPEDRERVLEKMEDVKRRKTNKLVVDYRVLCKDKTVRWVHDYTVYLTLSEKEISGYGYIIDITDRKEAERELRATMKRELKAEQRFRSIAEHFPNGWVALISTNMQIEYLGGSELPHFAAGSEIANTQSILTLFPPDSQEELKRAMNGALNGRPAKFDIQDGKKYYLINVVPTYSEKEEPDILMTGQDITTMKESLKKEKELNDLKSRFVSMTSHQFRTPLSTIQTNIELMTRSEEYIEPDFRPKFHRYASRTKRQIERLTDLMNDILILGRIEAGRLTPNKKPVKTIPFMKDIIRQYEQISKEDRRIELEIEGTPKKVNIDTNLMNHAVGNLLSNALKYSVGERNPEVRVLFNTYNVMIEIEDFGIGIPEDDLKNLFNSFFRASNTLEIEGTGLGMVISRQIIEAHGGHIAVYSLENQGTTVTLTLPTYEA